MLYLLVSNVKSANFIQNDPDVKRRKLPVVLCDGDFRVNENGSEKAVLDKGNFVCLRPGSDSA